MNRIKDDSWLITRPIAHRGLHGGEIPENGKSAFLNAIDHNCPIETDVQISKDGELFCFHDDNLKRMTGVDSLIWDKTSAEIKELRLSDSDDGIMTFEEFLNLVGGRVPLLIEIKTCPRYTELTKKALQILEGYKGEFAVQSFDPRVMGIVKKTAPEILRGQLMYRMRNKEINIIKDFILRNGLLNFISKPDFINVDYYNLPIPKRIRKKARLLCWTIRDKDAKSIAEKLAENYVFEHIEI